MGTEDGVEGSEGGPGSRTLGPAAALPHCTLLGWATPSPASLCSWCHESGRLGLWSHGRVPWSSALGAPRAGHGAHSGLGSAGQLGCDLS